MDIINAEAVAEGDAGICNGMRILTVSGAVGQVPPASHTQAAGSVSAARKSRLSFL
jgi:hypothetical protein